MAYGQTGSGKTYTMVGDDKNPGLYFTAVDNIFNTVKSKASTVDYDIKVSVIEIYNEQIRDLLSKNNQINNVKLMEGLDGSLYCDQV